MVQCGAEGLLVVPSLVEGLEDVDELSLVEAVEAGYHRIELPDMVLLLLRLQGATPDAETFGPFGEAVVRCREPSGQSDDVVLEPALRARPRDREGVQDEKGQMRLHESPRIPIEGERAQEAKEICVISLRATGPQEVRGVVDQEHPRRHEGSADRAAVRGACDIPKCDAWFQARQGLRVRPPFGVELRECAPTPRRARLP